MSKQVYFPKGTFNFKDSNYKHIVNSCLGTLEKVSYKLEGKKIFPFTLKVKYEDIQLDIECSEVKHTHSEYTILDVKQVD